MSEQLDENLDRLEDNEALSEEESNLLESVSESIENWAENLQELFDDTLDQSEKEELVEALDDIVTSNPQNSEITQSVQSIAEGLGIESYVSDSYEVQEWDSLWKIVTEKYPDAQTTGEIQDLIDQIVEENNMDNPDMIHPGDTLILPVSQNPEFRGSETEPNPDQEPEQEPEPEPESESEQKSDPDPEPDPEQEQERTTEWDEIEEDDILEQEEVNFGETNPSEDLEMLNVDEGWEVGEFIYGNFYPLSVEDENWVETSYWIPNERVENYETNLQDMSNEERLTLIESLRESYEVQDSGPYEVWDTGIEVENLALTKNELVQAYLDQQEDERPNMWAWDNETISENLRDNLADSDIENWAESIVSSIEDGEMDFNEFVNVLGVDLSESLRNLDYYSDNVTFEEDVWELKVETPDGEEKVDINNPEEIYNLLDSQPWLNNFLEDLYDLYENPDEEKIGEYIQDLPEWSFAVNEDWYAFELDAIQDWAIMRGEIDGEEKILQSQRYSSIDEMNLPDDAKELLEWLPEWTHPVWENWFMTIKDGEIYFTGPVEWDWFSINNLIPEWYDTSHGIRDAIIVWMAVEIWWTPNVSSALSYVGSWVSSVGSVMWSVVERLGDISLPKLSSTLASALWWLGLWIASTRMWYDDEIQAANHYAEADSVRTSYNNITGDDVDARQSTYYDWKYTRMSSYDWDREHSYRSEVFAERTNEEGDRIRVYDAPQDVDLSNWFGWWREIPFDWEIPGLNEAMQHHMDSSSVDTSEESSYFWWLVTVSPEVEFQWLEEIAINEETGEIDRENTTAQIRVSYWNEVQDVDINASQFNDEVKTAIKEYLRWNDRNLSDSREEDDDQWPEGRVSPVQSGRPSGWR